MVLIAFIFDSFILYNFNYWPIIPTAISQTLVIVGAVISIFHYNILKRFNKNISKPNYLVLKKGLFPYIRHPMYFGDMISCLGLFTLSANWATVVVLLISYVALFKQAQIEDGYLEELFGESFTNWSHQSKLIFPFVK
ncbi:MAG: methyltransferase [Candidatus Competibacteraceae bacterium]|nr:methyltransferase [Candidatus Competibacteraceae bacterium]